MVVYGPNYGTMNATYAAKSGHYTPWTAHGHNH
jgi:hypothetical protein